MTANPDTDDITHKLYPAAIRMLAAREHGAKELQRKLQRKFSDATAEQVDGVIDELQQQGLQDDARFAASLIRSRINRGYGPFYIQQDLQSKGIDRQTIDNCDEWASADWPELVHDLVQRRHPLAYSDARHWQKALRFLQRRGFDSGVIRKVLRDMPN